MPIILCLAAMLFAAISSIAAAQTDRSGLAPMPVQRLEQIYLACDQVSSRALLDKGTAAYCSMVSEELLERGFAGSFDRLLVWWRSARLRRAAAPTPDVGPRPGPSIDAGP